MQLHGTNHFLGSQISQSESQLISTISVFMLSSFLSTGSLGVDVHIGDVIVCSIFGFLRKNWSRGLLVQFRLYSYTKVSYLFWGNFWLFRWWLS